MTTPHRLDQAPADPRMRNEPTETGMAYVLGPECYEIAVWIRPVVSIGGGGCWRILENGRDCRRRTFTKDGAVKEMEMLSYNGNLCRLIRVTREMV